MSDYIFEDDRKPAAVEEKELQDIEKGEGGGVKLSPSAAASAARSSSTRQHKQSHKHSKKRRHHHHGHKSSRTARLRDHVENEKMIANNDLVASADSTKQPNDRKHPCKSSRTARRMDEVEDESIAKPHEYSTYAPSLMAHVYHVAVATDATDKNGKELLEEYCTMFKIYFLICSRNTYPRGAGAVSICPRNEPRTSTASNVACHDEIGKHF